MERFREYEKEIRRIDKLEKLIYLKDNGVRDALNEFL